MFDRVEAFYRPASASEALRLLDRGKGTARTLTCKTDLEAGEDGSIRVLIDLTRAGLDTIRLRGGTVAIGGTATWTKIGESDHVGGIAGGLLTRAAASWGSVQTRNLATIGGSLANAASASDLAAVLLALDASVTMAGLRGSNQLPLAQYLAAAGSIRFRKSLLLEVLVPKPRGERHGWSLQRFAHTAQDVPVVSVAAVLELDGDGCVKRARLALGSVAPGAIRAESAELHMQGRLLDRRLIAEVREAVSRFVDPPSDLRASAEYRRELCGVLTGRALEDCARQAGVTL